MKVAKTAAWMLLMGVVLWWATFLVMPIAIQWEVAPAVVERFPIFGPLLGAAVGLGMGFYEPLRQFVWLVLGSIFTGWLLWLLIVTCAGLGVTLILEGEAFEQTMEQVSAITSWLVALAVGVVILIGAFAIVQDKGAAMLERFRPKPPKTR